MSSSTDQTAPQTANKPWAGQRVPRKEDKRLLAGQGQFVDDVWMHRQGYAHFVRSPYAHARVLSVDVGPALEMAGVYTAMTGAEVREQTDPFFQIAPEPGGKIQEFPLAVDKVRYQGDPVAIVLAETRELARDAAEHVEVRYEPLDVVVDGVEAASPEAPVLHEEIGHNVAWNGNFSYEDIDWALENANHVVKIERLHFHRFSSTPLETFGAVVNWDPGTDMVEIRSNNQMPMFGSMMLSPTLRCGVDQLFWHSQDIGGGFGIKIVSYPQIGALALLSRKAGRPVKWSETRSEHMLSSGHGSERTFLDLEAAVMADGTILGFRCRPFDDAGAYLHYEPLGAVIWAQVLTSCYRFKHLTVDYTETLTNKCPSCPNRGYSRLQHMWMIERLVDTVAQQLDFDPVELRKRNYVQPEDYPYETPNGCVYDSGDMPRELDLALEKLGYEDWRKRQAEVNSAGGGKRIGIGIGSTLDSGTNNFGQARIVNPDLPFSGNGEAAIAKLDLYGELAVFLGTTPQGQSHETTTAQVVADMLGVEPDAVRVYAGFNKDQSTYVGFSGTYASQFAVTGIGAAIGSVSAAAGEMTGSVK
jgi:CO/xanthine dehydrogenase Mo-binding subunit